MTVRDSAQRTATPRAARLACAGAQERAGRALFMAVAVFGLWLSRDYPIGTALRMGTGYVPRLLCWILLGARRHRAGAGPARAPAPRACGSPARVGVAAARLSSPRASSLFGADASSGSGWCVAILLLIGIGALATRDAAAARDVRRRAGADRAVLGDLHRRARAHDPGLAGVVADGASRQPRASVSASR